MCDLKSFSFSHHFGSGFKYFSATIIRKLSKMLNLRLSGEIQGRFNTHNTDKHCFRKKVYEEVILQRFSENRVFCVNRVKGGDGRRQAYYSMPARRSNGSRIRTKYKKHTHPVKDSPPSIRTLFTATHTPRPSPHTSHKSHSAPPKP